MSGEFVDILDFQKYMYEKPMDAVHVCLPDNEQIET